MQVAGDACALTDARLQLQVEFPRDLMEAVSMEANEHSQKGGGA
jgi:hypothetical protein